MLLSVLHLLQTCVVVNPGRRMWDELMVFLIVFFSMDWRMLSSSSSLETELQIDPATPFLTASILILANCYADSTLPPHNSILHKPTKSYQTPVMAWLDLVLLQRQNVVGESYENAKMFVLRLSFLCRLLHVLYSKAAWKQHCKKCSINKLECWGSVII